MICRTFSYLSDNKLVKCDTTALCIEPPAGPVYGPCGADQKTENTGSVNIYIWRPRKNYENGKGPSCSKPCNQGGQTHKTGSMIHFEMVIV